MSSPGSCPVTAVPTINGAGWNHNVTGVGIYNPLWFEIDMADASEVT